MPAGGWEVGCLRWKSTCSSLQIQSNAGLPHVKGAVRINILMTRAAESGIIFIGAGTGSPLLLK
jgi:hypothetical protein